MIFGLTYQPRELVFPVLVILLLRQHRKAHPWWVAKKAVLPVEVVAIDEAQMPDPWPRVRKIVAIAVVLFAASQTILDGHLVYTSLYPPPSGPYPRSSAMDAQMAARGVLTVADFAACCLMIIGVLQFFQRRHSVLLMVVGARLWLAFWLIGMIVNQLDRGFYELVYIANNAISIMMPLVMLLLFREYAKRNPQPQD
jgi:hypothetical protein